MPDENNPDSRQQAMNPTSGLMRFFLAIGQESIAWSLRRLWCPVSRQDLVLEVGSGGNPYFRANVLLDAYEETQERHWQPLVSDRPTVLGFVEKLPFRDKCFDFVIASHVLEHSRDPEAFLSELQRVAKAGYIEVPDALFERLNPYNDHRLEITERQGKLIIRGKKGWQADPELVELYENRVKPILTGETMRRHPFLFHVRHYWQNRIDFEYLNPGVSLEWEAPDSGRQPNYTPGARARLAGMVLNLCRKLFSQNRRNRSLDLRELLQCPECRSEELHFSAEKIDCQGCGLTFANRQGIPVMVASD
jgi:SAM-dependent methyltransferase